MLYSVRMRAAQGGPHEQGGRHISGAERIVDGAKVEHLLTQMVERALHHSRGQADFINLTIEQVDLEQAVKVPLLQIHTLPADDVEGARRFAMDKMTEAGVSRQVAATAFSLLDELADSMRGAMLVDAVTGQRLDTGMRGVRVSRMDASDEQALYSYLHSIGTDNTHAREAVILASKVMSAPGIVAELCWSDDPEYTTGYVAAKETYTRITNLKHLGSEIGGRVFFVASGTEVEVLRDYLENTPVLVTVPGGTK